MLATRWLLVMLPFGCARGDPARIIVGDSVDAADSSTATMPSTAPANALPWTERFDFDGDGERDRVDVDFTGGAHCCYLLSITMTSRGVVALPFEIDGGYVGGLSLERPDNFDVEVGSDGVATLVMTVATYAGRALPIPAAWTRDFGVRSHSIRVDARSGTIRVDNL